MTLDRSGDMGRYGGGHVYQRGGVWWVQYYAHGRRHRESSGSETKAVANRLLNRRLAEAGYLPVFDGDPTYEDAVDAVRDHYARNNRGSPEKRLKRLRPFFQGLDLRRITTAKLTAYRAYRRREGVAEATINRELAMLRTMMNLLRKHGVPLTLPHFPMAKEKNVRTGFVGEDEIALVLDNIRSELRPLVEFAYVTGWRKGEILSRDWSHVTDRAVRLEPGQTKNDAGREFPLIPRLRAVVDTQRERMGDHVGGPLFFWTPGRRIKSFKESWQAAVDAAGLPGLLFHDLRRSAVRNLVLAGIDEHTAMALTGHKTRSVFDRYDIIDSARLHEQASKLEAFYGTQDRKVRAIR